MGARSARRRLQTSIRRQEHGAVGRGDRQQVGVRDLLVSEQMLEVRFHLREARQRPQMAVLGIRDQSGEHAERLGGRLAHAHHGGVRREPHEAKFGEHARSPVRGGAALQPIHDGPVELMVGPCESHECVDVEQQRSILRRFHRRRGPSGLGRRGSHRRSAARRTSRNVRWPPGCREPARVAGPAVPCPTGRARVAGRWREHDSTPLGRRHHQGSGLFAWCNDTTMRVHRNFFGARNPDIPPPVIAGSGVRGSGSR